MKQVFIFSLFIVFCFAAQFGLSRFLEDNAAEISSEIAETDLAFKGETLRQISLGFDGLIADYYWMSALQYIGGKLVSVEGEIQLDNLRPLNPRLLFPLLDTATTLDPQFGSVYSYGSMVLPAVNFEQAVRISEKGVAAQPENWRMYHNLGYIYWRSRNFKKAAETYALGASKPNAPEWMRVLSGNMQAQGGSRDTAREIYRQLYENALDEQTKDVAARRLLQVESFDERDAINAQLQSFKNQNDRCAANWQEVFFLLRQTQTLSGKPLRFADSLEPLDPSDAPYYLNNQSADCKAEINPQKSKIPAS